MATIYVKPASGGRVRMPERRSAVMAEAGAFVPRNDYYERLLIGGDVIEAEPPAKAGEFSEPVTELSSDLPPAAESASPGASLSKEK